jgi:chitodextrinase
MGTEIGIGGSGAIRSMDNPSSFGDPDTYGGTYWTNPNCGFPTQSNDYCGVHSNSGVQNKWFYILVAGENGTNDIGSNYSVTGIGHEKAAAIAYRNLEVYLSANSTFADARTGAIQSAVDLYGAGSPEEIATTDAWYAVGVGDPFGGPPPATCYGGGITLTINTDNYGSETSWTLKDSGGATIDSGSGYANNTTYTFNFNLADGDYTFTINDSYGDGICCGYGNGSYSLVSGAETIRTGGAFGSFETTNICVDNGGTPPPDTQAPTNPGNLTASNETTSSVDLSWSASTDNVGVTGYHVYVDNAFVGTTANTSATVSGLAENTTFSFKVTALDAAGNESSGSSVNATTLSSGPAPDTEAPSNPGSLTASNETTSSVDLSWSASTDNVGVTGYNVYVDNVFALTTATTASTVSGLADNTTFTFKVTALDAAGNESSGSTVNATTLPSGGGGGSDVLIGSYFESGWDGWTDGGSDCYRDYDTRSYEGNYSIRLRDNSGVASSMTTASTYNLTGYDQVEIDFYFYPYSMENGEDFWVQLYNGSSYQTVAAYAAGTSFNNNGFYHATITVSSADYNFASNARFRIRCDASANGDQIYVDAITITASSTAGFMGQQVASGQKIQLLSSPPVAPAPTFDIGDNASSDVAAELQIFPNPATDILQVMAAQGTKLRSISVYDISGRRLMIRHDQSPILRLEVSELAAGVYFLHIETDQGVERRKFIKH